MRRLINKIKEKLGIPSSKKGKKNVKEKSWEERKKELLANVRTEGKRKSAPPKKRETTASKGQAKKDSPVPASKDRSVKTDRYKSRSADKQKERPEKQKERFDRQKERPEKKSENPEQQRERPEQQRNKPEQIQAAPEDNWDVSQFNVEPFEGKKRFQDFDLPKEIMHAIADLGFKYCTPIQAEILSKTLAGKDASGKAQTGTGKTAAFLITIFSNFLKNPSQRNKPGTPRALIMAPTRELVMQIASDARGLAKYTNIKTLAVMGGIDYRKQKSSLTNQIFDVVVATPGRLLDFYSKKDLDLSNIQILVIDEADRMMDMGFIPDMRKIIRATPHKDKRQTLLFSATLPPEVLRLASSWTKDSEVVDIEPDQIAGKNVEQIIYIVTSEQKYFLLYNTIVQKKLDRVIVFTNRRDEAKKLMDLLYTQGINTAVLSGDVDQRKRMKTLTDFKEGKINILVATDVAGRGIHIEGISHVINFNLPEDPEDYVHRIGRTGRAGADGISISFACEDDSFQIPAIEKYLGHKLEYTEAEEDLLKPPPPPVREAVWEAPKPKPQYQNDKPQRRRPPYKGRR
ncbi:MAG: DEAD/DEAH box helicase [Ignavibacteriaceae bacterium]